VDVLCGIIDHESMGGDIYGFDRCHLQGRWFSLSTPGLVLWGKLSRTSSSYEKSSGGHASLHKFYNVPVVKNIKVLAYISFEWLPRLKNLWYFVRCRKYIY
jgi:hypothetical protein